jgi:hypothetical protein
LNLPSRIAFSISSIWVWLLSRLISALFRVDHLDVRFTAKLKATTPNNPDTKIAILMASPSIVSPRRLAMGIASRLVRRKK